MSDLLIERYLRHIITSETNNAFYILSEIKGKCLKLFYFLILKKSVDTKRINLSL